MQHAAAGRGWQRGQVAWRRSPHALPPEAPCCRRPELSGLSVAARRAPGLPCRRPPSTQWRRGRRSQRGHWLARGAGPSCCGSASWGYLGAGSSPAPPPARSRCVYGGALCTPHGPRPFLKKAMLPNATCPLCVGPGATNPPITNNQPRPPQGRPPLWRTLGAFFGSCTQTSCPLSSHAPPLGTSQPCFAPPGHPQCPGAGALPLPMNPAMQHWGGGVGRRKAQQQRGAPSLGPCAAPSAAPGLGLAVSTATTTRGGRALMLLAAPPPSARR